MTDYCELFLKFNLRLQFTDKANEFSAFSLIPKERAVDARNNPTRQDLFQNELLK